MNRERPSMDHRNDRDCLPPVVYVTNGGERGLFAVVVSAVGA
jgi:hypothetical protein